MWFIAIKSNIKFSDLIFCCTKLFKKKNEIIDSTQVSFHSKIISFNHNLTGDVKHDNTNKTNRWYVDRHWFNNSHTLKRIIYTQFSISDPRCILSCSFGYILIKNIMKITSKDEYFFLSFFQLTTNR